MQAFHNNSELKEMYVTGKFTLNSKDDYPKLVGLPKWLPIYMTRINEGLSEEDSISFSSWVLPAIPVGSDITDVKKQLAVLRHKNQILTLESSVYKSAIQMVVDYIEKDIKKIHHNIGDIRVDAYDALYPLKGKIAESAMRSISEYNHDDSGFSITLAAEASYNKSKWSNHYKWEADNLIQLLKDSK